MEELDLVVQHLGIAPVRLDEIHHIGQSLVGAAAVVADAGDAQRSHLPHILVLDLGDGDIELTLHLRGDRPDNHPLALERVIFRDAQPDLQSADIHSEKPQRAPRPQSALTSVFQLSVAPVNHTMGRLSNIFKHALETWASPNSKLWTSVVEYISR